MHVERLLRLFACKSYVQNTVTTRSRTVCVWTGNKDVQPVTTVTVEPFKWAKTQAFFEINDTWKDNDKKQQCTNRIIMRRLIFKACTFAQLDSRYCYCTGFYNFTRCEVSAIARYLHWNVRCIVNCNGSIAFLCDELCYSAHKIHIYLSTQFSLGAADKRNILTLLIDQCIRTCDTRQSIKWL